MQGANPRGTGTRNGTSIEDGCLDSRYEGWPKIGDRLPRRDGGQSRDDGAETRKDAVRSGASGGPYGTSRSENWHRAKDAAHGRASNCRAPRKGKATDPRRLCIPEEVGCRLQEDNPPCRSGTAQGKLRQENLVPRKFWTAEGIGCRRNEDDPLCRSGTA
jgi:hypothetical protein